jgi:hypothetical protein
MKQALVMAAILLFGLGTHAQSLAQPSVSKNCGEATSCSVGLANPITVGNTLLAIVRVGFGNTAPTQVSDNLGSTYTLDGSSMTADGHEIAVYRAPITTAGAVNLSISHSAAWSVRIIGFEEIAGLVNGPPDAVASAVGSGNSPQAGTLTTTQANDYVLLGMVTATSEAFTFTCNGGFACEQSVLGGAFADQTAAAIASVNGSMSLSFSDTWAAIAIAYKTTPRVPLSLQLNYSDGTPVLGSVRLASVSATTTTPVTSWPISSTGAVAAYLPLVTSGTYSYTAFDPTGKQLQGIAILPGAFAALGLHALNVTVTLNKSTDALMIPASISME